MVRVSHETTEQMEKRLLKVIAESDFAIYKGSYTFEEFPLNDFLSSIRQDAIALVRDSEVWSQLVPSNKVSKELFKIFSFHFDDCKDNSGFVGWLASRLKTKLGTGVFVLCGYNTNRGGIFDYWGCPIELEEKVTGIINELIETGRQLLV